MSRPDRASSAPHAAAVEPLAGDDPPGHLATGWEPYRPVDDGLVRRFVYAYASSFAGPTRLVDGRVIRDDAYVVWDQGRPTGFYNGASLLQPLPYDGWEDVLDRLEDDLLVPGSRGDVVLLSPWSTPDLRARGWELLGHPPMLLRPAGPPPEVSSPSWLEVRPVGDAAALADWERVVVEGYPLDECRPYRPQVLFDARILADPAWHAWVGYDDGEPVTVGTVYVAHGVCVLTLGATLPEYRGRGAWREMARLRLAAFADLPAISIFSDYSRGPAESIGFLPLQRWTLWERNRS